MHHFAGIGTREPTKEILDICFLLGQEIAKAGHILKSGNAIGCDNAFMMGASSIDPSKVIACLPWKGYNNTLLHPKWKTFIEGQGSKQLYRLLIKTLHPKWNNLKDSVKALHTRNAAIIDNCICVFAAPKTNSLFGGGTEMGIKIAKHMSIPVINLNETTPQKLEKIIKRLHELT